MDLEFGLLHVAGGESRQSPPPGTLAQSAPRRSARGRASDQFFVSLGAHDLHVEQLASDAARAFFGTPGSVTAALRQAAVSVNRTLMDSGLQAAFIAGALRHKDLYLAQCGAGQAVLIRSGSVARIAADQANSRPLGSALVPMVQFSHLELQPGDLLVTSNTPGEGWSDALLAGLAGLSLTQALDRLGAITTRDLKGLVLRIPGGPPPAAAPARPDQGESTAAAASARPDQGESTAATAPAGVVGPARGSGRAAAQARRASRRSATPADQPGAYDVSVSSAGRLATTAATIRGWFRVHLSRLRSTVGRAWNIFAGVMLRLAPGLLEAPRPGEFSPNVLAFTAAAVPIVVVGLSALIYFNSGRAEQFEAYLAQAEAAAASARVQSDPQAARPEWVLASQWLDLAEGYKQTERSEALREQVRAALDELDLIVRLEFVPTVSGGFGPEAELVSLAATATELYAYDRGTETIWHAWSTGRGYEIDSQFDCLAGRNSIPDFGSPVSMVIQPEPGALGTEGVVAMDADGTLLYCAPGVQPLIGQLVSPNVGWGQLSAAEVYGGDLYVLDPAKNAVWIYDATDGLFSGSPALYFVDDVQPLGTAIDLALAQDELIILYADGSIDRCQRLVENTTSGTLRIRVECESEPRFQDERPGQPPQATIPGASPSQIVYSAPPEPSLFFMDAAQGTVYHYSMRLVYQGQYPTPFGSQIGAITEGPPNNLYVAAGDQVYVAQLGR